MTDEKPGYSEKLELTTNGRGFMHELNEISESFIEFGPNSPGLVVDVGAAYGVATIPLLDKKVSVIACDMTSAHLEELSNRASEEQKKYLITFAGHFPEGYHFEKESVGAILLSHVLHFLSPEEMDAALDKIYQWLIPGGKVFIAGYSPYGKQIENYIPIYEARKSEGHAWPFWQENNIKDNAVAHEDVLNNLPDTMNHFDLAELVPALVERGFALQKADYLDPDKNNIPDTVRLDGREWIGVIAQK